MIMPYEMSECIFNRHDIIYKENSAQPRHDNQSLILLLLRVLKFLMPISQFIREGTDLSYEVATAQNFPTNNNQISDFNFFIQSICFNEPCDNNSLARVLEF